MNGSKHQLTWQKSEKNKTKRSPKVEKADRLVQTAKKGNNRILSKEMNDVQKAYLKAIKVDETIFTELKS